MKSLLTKIISVLTICTLCVGLCACGTTLNEENCENGHSLVETSYTAPTCKTNGQKVSKCSRCDYTETETLLPIDHNYEIKTTTPSTCSTHGSTSYECSMCYDRKTITLPLLNHNYKLIKETPSTCTVKGSKEYECEDCSDSYSAELELLNHNYKTIDTATCFTDGELKNVCNECQHEERIETTSMLTHQFGTDGYCAKCGIYETLIDIDNLNTTHKKGTMSAGTTGSMVTSSTLRVQGNLTPKFKYENSIPYTYFETHRISLTIYLYSENNEPLYSQTILSTINYYKGDSQYTMTLQYGGFVNGCANQFRLDLGVQAIDNTKSFKIEISCEGYKTIEKTYEIAEA